MVFMLKLKKEFSKEEKINNKKLTLRRLIQVLDINPKTGECHWKVANSNRVKVGDRAGTIWKDPYVEGLYYRYITIDRKRYLEHIIIWFFVHNKWPSRDLDHRNRNGLDNRIKNLRLATGTQNGGNTIIPKNNTSGRKGVYWNKKRKKWIANIGYKRKYFSSKGYDNREEAYQWYCNMHKKLFKEFSRTK
jgi:hypothetical protein